MRESKAKQPHKTVTAIGDSIERAEHVSLPHTRPGGPRTQRDITIHNDRQFPLSGGTRSKCSHQSCITAVTGRVRYRLSFQSVLVIRLFVRVLLTLFAYHAFLCCSTRPFVTCRVLSWLQSMWLCHSFADKCMATIEPLI